MNASMLTTDEVDGYRIKTMSYLEERPFVFHLTFTHDKLPSILVRLEYRKRKHSKGIYCQASAKGWDDVPVTTPTAPVEKEFKTRAVSFVESVIKVDESKIWEE